MIPPQLGLLVWSALLVLLLRYASAKDDRSSSALWVPVLWLSLAGSRSLAQWLGLLPPTVEVAFEEGSPLDRTVYLLLMGLALWVLAKRQIRWHETFARNVTLTLFLLFALASVIWSDFPYITFKRWIRDLGTYVMVLVVLSDPRPADAISIVIRRVSSVLVMFSVVLIKYYTELGVTYGAWSGAPEYIGATTSKNMLGALCLLSGLFYFWDTLQRWGERKDRQSRRLLFVNLVLLAMTLWLLRLSQSATSQGSFIVGCFIIVLVRSKWAKVKPDRVKALIPAGMAGYLVLEFMFDFSTTVAEFFGRDPTLHGRTGIWDAVLAQQTNPLWGVGYQTFWLGDRLVSVSGRLQSGIINEAHNGYLEIYLNLGVVGLCLLVLFMISSYRRVFRQLSGPRSFAPLSIGLWTVTAVYNVTESGFGASLIWFALLLYVIDVPRSGGLRPSKSKRPAPEEAIVRSYGYRVHPRGAPSTEPVGSRRPTDTHVSAAHRSK